MNIAIIGSGGDGAGMNECLFNLCKKLKSHNIVLFYHGLQGIIDNEIADIDYKTIENERYKGGIIIKSSRSSEFMTDKGFNKFKANLKKHKIDVLIIMGGNGSLQATKKIINAGINCIFIPTTIDNDIADTDYSIGFSTAVNNAIDYINKVDTSMKAFDRTCIYEVMGRHCPDIANSVANAVKACFCFTAESKKQDLLNAVKKELKVNSAPIIVLQENTVNIEELKEYLQEKIKNIDIKTAVVGYVQRGGFATKQELSMAKNFADNVAQCIKKHIYNVMVGYNSKAKNFQNIKICN